MSLIQMVQQWPPLQRTAVPAGSDEEEPSGINMEKARERLRVEDQEFDKQEYSRKVKEKHRVGRRGGGPTGTLPGRGTALHILQNLYQPNKVSGL